MERAAGAPDEIRIRKRAETAMMVQLKELKQGIQDKPWNLFAKKKSEPAAVQGTGDDVIAKSGAFCNPDSDKACVTVCSPGPGCTCDADAVRQALNSEMARSGLSLEVGNAKMGCDGKCNKGVLVGFPQKGFFYLGVKPEDIPEIVQETFIRGRILFPLVSISPNRSFRSDIYYERETGLIAAIDDSVCMVEVAKYFLDFEEGLSCGKCVPCRLGMKRMQEGMNRIVAGEGTEDDLEQIRLLCRTMMEVPHCEFAVTSSRPVLSAMTYFEDEFRAHVERKECPAGVCKDLVELQKKLARRRKKKK